MSKREKDFFYNLAKKKGVVARSYFKLEHIQSKYKILKNGHSVFDIGCAPGSWLQFASGMIGPTGRLYGIDLNDMNVSLPNIIFFKEDIYDFDIKSFYDTHGLVDTVLSDIAPNTTGHKIIDVERSFQLCKKSLRIGATLLKPKGNFVCKMYQGERFDDFHQLMKKAFEKVNIYRPKATRKISREIFWVGQNKKDNDAS